MKEKCEVELKNTDELMDCMEYIKHFNIHYKLLIRRYNRFKEINDIHNMDIDVITYLDIIVVQLRAICIESPQLKKNYTIQNLLRKIGKDNLATQIDQMLEEPFIDGTDFSIKKAIKTLADGFICHYDNFDSPQDDGWVFAEIIEKELRNPYAVHNLDYIIQKLIDCIGEGLTIKLVKE